MVCQPPYRVFRWKFFVASPHNYPPESRFCLNFAKKTSNTLKYSEHCVWFILLPQYDLQRKLLTEWWTGGKYFLQSIKAFLSSPLICWPVKGFHFSLFFFLAYNFAKQLSHWEICKTKLGIKWIFQRNFFNVYKLLHIL